MAEAGGIYRYIIYSSYNNDSDFKVVLQFSLIASPLKLAFVNGVSVSWTDYFVLYCFTKNGKPLQAFFIEKFDSCKKYMLLFYTYTLRCFKYFCKAFFFQQYFTLWKAMLDKSGREWFCWPRNDFVFRDVFSMVQSYF